MYKTRKDIFFRTESAARRFIQLYGYDNKYVEHISYPYEYYGVKYDYYGVKVRDMYHVSVRASSEETEQWKKLGAIKEKKWNGHKCYIFEG